jgi:menaquinol-cytochrome c reductase iron-sulfur subunit
MPKSLKPAGKPSGRTPDLTPATPPVPPLGTTHSGDVPRRNMVVAAAAAILGALVGLVPLGAGLALFLDPILRRKTAGGSEGGKPGESGKPFRRVASLDMLPTDGTPVQVPVIADLSDAWNREPNQPIGAVYLRRVGNEVECLNAICPHAGCFVAYANDRKCFACPCHTSSFTLNGEIIKPSPSPRDMDALKVDPDKLKEGEVWVQFVNFYPGHEEREEKP